VTLDLVERVERATLLRKPMWYSLPAHCAQAGLDVAQALAISELGEGHRQILISAGEVLGVVIAAKRATHL
jgi:hypothetical protein